MTAITTTSAVPSVGGDADTWGTKLNAKWATVKADLDMLNTAAANSILGRNEGTSGEVERLTGTEVTAMLDPVTGDTGSGGTKGLVPAPASGDAAAYKFLRANGTWADIAAARGLFTGSTGATVSAKNMSCTRSGSGDYAIAFTSALASANYQVFVTFEINALYFPAQITAKTVNGFDLDIYSYNSGTPIQADPTQFSVLVLF